MEIPNIQEIYLNIIKQADNLDTIINLYKSNKMFHDLLQDRMVLNYLVIKFNIKFTVNTFDDLIRIHNFNYNFPRKSGYAKKHIIDVDVHSKQQVTDEVLEDMLLQLFREKVDLVRGDLVQIKFLTDDRPYRSTTHGIYVFDDDEIVRLMYDLDHEGCLPQNFLVLIDNVKIDYWIVFDAETLIVWIPIRQFAEECIKNLRYKECYNPYSEKEIYYFRTKFEHENKKYNIIIVKGECWYVTDLFKYDELLPKVKLVNNLFFNDVQCFRIGPSKVYDYDYNIPNNDPILVTWL